jgi:acyl dehydratase
MAFASKFSAGGVTMLPEEMAGFVGKSIGVVVCEVEKSSIKRFADAVEETNPLYYDEDYAAKSKYGSIIAPPGFFGWPVKLPRGATFMRPTDISDPPETTEAMRVALAKVGYANVLDGGIEYEFFVPVRAGDMLTAKSIVKEIREREGKTGKMAFVIIETTYHNQNKELVAVSRGTAIYR